MSIADLAPTLPAPQKLLWSAQTLATFDILANEDEHMRSHQVNLSWGPGEQVAVMDDGGGNGWSVTLTEHGAFLRDFDHESFLSPWDPEYAHDDWVPTIPPVLQAAAREPAFVMDDLIQVSCAAWWLNTEPSWHPVKLRTITEKTNPMYDDDGSSWLFSELLGGADALITYADMYEVDLARADAEHLVQHRPMTSDLLARINPQRSWDQVIIDLAPVGYPVSKVTA